MLGFTVCKAENQFAVILSNLKAFRIGARRQEMMRGISTELKGIMGCCVGGQKTNIPAQEEEENLPSANLPSKD